MCVSWIVPPETVPQLFFRPFGAESVPTPMSPVRTTPYPRLAPWAVILRRCEALIPLSNSRSRCDTVSSGTRVSFSLLQSRSAGLSWFAPPGLNFSSRQVHCSQGKLVLTQTPKVRAFLFRRRTVRVSSARKKSRNPKVPAVQLVVARIKL
jgi:hypothetical protein